jgi:hypothetical protein
MIDIQQYRADYIWHNIVTNISTHHFFPQLSFKFVTIPNINIIVGTVAVIIILVIFRKLLVWKYYVSQKSVFLELTPPAFTDKSAFTTEQLFSVIHNMGSQPTIIDRILGKKVLFSFEIVSTREKGIRYIVRTTSDEADILKHNIVAYMPYIRVTEVADYLPHDKKVKISEFVLRKHFALPLAKQNMLSQHDPVAYITGMMTQLKPNELIAFQIVVSPTKNPQSDTISQKILRNEDVLDYLDRFHLPWFFAPITFVFMVFGKGVQAVLWVINDFSLSKDQRYAMQSAEYINYQISSKVRPARQLSSFEQDIISSIQKKSDQLLFETTIRAYVSVDDNNDQTQRLKGIRSALAPFSVPKYQSLRAKYNFFPLVIDHIRLFAFDKRLLSFFGNKSSSLLSESEIADLYHFPFTNITKTENIAKVYSKVLPAPTSLKRDRELSVIFGKNTYGNVETPIGLTKEERETHQYLIGRTGGGKTTLMFAMAKHDIENGAGMAFVDPHGDVSKDLVYCVPEDRKDDLIYLNPIDLKHPVRINLLELTPGLDEDEAELEKEVVCEGVISLFRKVFSKEANTIPIYSANNAVINNRESVQPPEALGKALIIAVYAPEDVRARRLQDRSPDLVANKPEEAAYRLADRAISMYPDAHIVVKDFGRFEGRARSDIVTMMRLLVQNIL